MCKAYRSLATPETNNDESSYRTRRRVGRTGRVWSTCSARRPLSTPHLIHAALQEPSPLCHQHAGRRRYWLNERPLPPSCASHKGLPRTRRKSAVRASSRIRCWYGDVVNAISIERLERWMSGTTIAVWQFKVRQQESSEREIKRSVRQQLVSTDFSISFTVSETSQVRTVISSIYELISCGIILAKRGLR